MITHLWEVGYLIDPEDPNSKAGYRIEIIGVDWEKREFRQSFQGENYIEIKNRVMDFIIDHYKPLEKYTIT